MGEGGGTLQIEKGHLYSLREVDRFCNERPESLVSNACSCDGTAFSVWTRPALVKKTNFARKKNCSKLDFFYLFTRELLKHLML